MADEACAARQHMLEALSMYSDELMELLLAEEDVPEPLIHDVVRQAVLAEQMTPVLLGTAYRNKGVQPLLDAVIRYLPSPRDVEAAALDCDDPQREIPLVADPNEPAVAMAFKIAEDPYGALTFLRVYQGRVVKGDTYYNQRSGRKERIGRLVRMHADQREEIDEAATGDIVAALGLDCASGDTYAATPGYCTLQTMHVPEPVIQMAIAPLDRDGVDRLGKALGRFRREDPTLQVTTGQRNRRDAHRRNGGIASGSLRRADSPRIPRGRRRRTAQGELPRGPTQAAEFNVRHRNRPAGRGSTLTSSGGWMCCPRTLKSRSSSKNTSLEGECPSSSFRRWKRGCAACSTRVPWQGIRSWDFTSRWRMARTTRRTVRRWPSRSAPAPPCARRCEG